MIYRPFHGNQDRGTLDLWGKMVISLGRIHLLERLSGFEAEEDGETVGTIFYHIENGECEIVSLSSQQAQQGVGSELLSRVMQVARENGCRRVWLTTTNDNLNAMRFFQKRGFDLVALHRDAIAEARKIDSSIPRVGQEHIPVRHELEFEYLL